MKLEKVIINGVEYYQWIILGTYPKFINTVGDLFTDWRDIQLEKLKLQQSC